MKSCICFRNLQNLVSRLFQSFRACSSWALRALSSSSYRVFFPTVSRRRDSLCEAASLPEQRNRSHWLAFTMRFELNFLLSKSMDPQQWSNMMETCFKSCVIIIGARSSGVQGVLNRLGGATAIEKVTPSLEGYTVQSIQNTLPEWVGLVLNVIFS